jgi:hypothetical protein
LSSGLACVSGWPGGARGRRIEPMIDFRLRFFEREDFIGTIGDEFETDAIPRADVLSNGFLLGSILECEELECQPQLDCSAGKRPD